MKGPSLAGRTLVITGASRGIGLAIALRAAADGANVAILAKTDTPHPKLPGTIRTAAAQIIEAGGNALPLAVDIRHETAVRDAVEATVARFGGIDILVNNASAISLTGTAETELKRFDLMHDINTRGTFVCTRACLPHLKRSSNAHVLNIAPPLNMNPRWFAPHVAYTIAKFGMSLCVLGMAEEFRPFRIAVNALWPRTVIATAALQMNPYVEARRCRKPEIMADAAHAILTRDAARTTGQFLIDEDLLRAEGMTDFEQYAVEPGQELQKDWFLD